jgi:dTDP-4-dehydrorhamnose 3,5-epimerase
VWQWTLRVKLLQTPLAGLIAIDVTAVADERGLFARTYDAATFLAAGMPVEWPQCNTSYNTRRCTLRGMHFQKAPDLEAKLVRCTRGSAFDVAVDVRPHSPTFCKWFGLELSAGRRNALFIPPGFAHGFLTLEDDTEIFYQMGTTYVAELASGVRWNDPAFAIAWPETPRVIAPRDAAYPDFAASLL